MGDKKRTWIVAGGLLFAGAAWSSPWDIDMIDSRSLKAYEWVMRTPKAPGTVQRNAAVRAQPVGYYQNDYIPNVDRVTPEGSALTNPFAGSRGASVDGKRLFQVSCAPCHGVDGLGGGPVTHNDPAKDIRRFLVPAPTLAGPGAVSALRSDGYMYLTIRNGGALMPAYGVSLTDAERWSIVSYIRTLEGGAYAAPAVVPSPAPVTTPEGAPAPAPTSGGTP